MKTVEERMEISKKINWRHVESVNAIRLAVRDAVTVICDHFNDVMPLEQSSAGITAALVLSEDGVELIEFEWPGPGIPPIQKKTQIVKL